MDSFVEVCRHLYAGLIRFILLLSGCLLVVLPAQAGGLLHLLEHQADIDRTCDRVQAVKAPPEVVIDEIFSEVIYKTPGQDRGSEQLFRPIRTVAEPLARLGSACLDGDTASCWRFENWTHSLVKADALRFDRAKHQSSPVSFVTGTLSGNLTIRPIALYAGAMKEKGLIGDRDEAALISWLNRRIDEYDNFPQRLSPDSAQNLVLNSVIARQAVDMMASKSTAKNSRGTQRAEGMYRLYLDTAREDGSFPQETRRGVSALKYTNMAIGLLVVMAEMAEADGLSIYPYASLKGVDIHKTVEFMVSSLENESFIEGYAKENYAPTDKVEGAGQARHFMKDHIGWMWLYIRRFPGHLNTPRLIAVVASEKSKKRGYFDEILGVFVGCGG